MAIFFTSDLHFYHANVIAFCKRPYRTKNPYYRLKEWWTGRISMKSAEVMNETLIANWNSVVSQDDDVYCLGDFSLAFRAVELFSHRLNGRKFLIPGNHDFCHSYHKKSRKPEGRAKWIKKYEDHGWIVLPEQTTLKLQGVDQDLELTLSHMPYTNIDDVRDGKDKYSRFRPIDIGNWLLCGHVHEKWATRRKMINVGVDVRNYKPISLDEIIRITKAS